MTALLQSYYFWMSISLLIFIALAWKPAVRGITGSLDNRALRIRSELDEARRLRDEAEQLLAEYRRREREGAAQAQSIITHAREEAERIAAQAARDLDLLLARRQRLAEERIAQAEARAAAEVRAAAVDTAIAAAREVIATQIDEQRGGALIDSAIAALPQRLR
jgi:F-type H+-transporting ATPase subunit b